MLTNSAPFFLQESLASFQFFLSRKSLKHRFPSGERCQLSVQTGLNGLPETEKIGREERRESKKEGGREEGRQRKEGGKEGRKEGRKGGK